MESMVKFEILAGKLGIRPNFSTIYIDRFKLILTLSTLFPQDLTGSNNFFGPSCHARCFSLSWFRMQIFRNEILNDLGLFDQFQAASQNLGNVEHFGKFSV